MKKGFLVCAIFLLIVCVSTSAMAAEAKRGEEVTVGFTFSTSEGTYAVVSFGFDKNNLSFVSATGTDGATPPGSANGTFQLNNGTNIISSGSHGSITFKVKENAAPGTYLISANVAECYNNALDDVSGSASFGSITVVVDDEPCAHENSTWNETKAATCTETGTKELVCDKCHEVLQTETIPALEHDWDEWKETTAPTCSTKGEETRVCKRNSAHKETRDVDINPDAHDWDEWKETTAPTCMAKGQETRVCKLNDTHKETRDVDIDPDAHDWNDWVTTKEPQVGVAGEKTRTCKLNGEHKETQPISPLCDHEWGQWTSTKAATCTEKGEEKRTCNKCSDTETRETEINPDAHDWGDWAKTKAATCTEPGEETRVCKRDETHKETRETEKDPKNHDWGEWKETKAATCTEKGEETRVCKRDETHKETRETEINPDAHDWGEWVDSENHPGHMERRCKNNDAHVEYDPPLQVSDWRRSQTVSSLGIRFRDIAPNLTKEWDMFTPIDLSVDGVQVIDLIAANITKVGTVTVKVESGTVTVNYKVAYPAVENDMAFTILPNLASVTDVNIKNLKTYSFGKEISIADELDGDTRVLLYVSGHVDYDFKDERNELFIPHSDSYQQLAEQLREIMD